MIQIREETRKAILDALKAAIRFSATHGELGWKAELALSKLVKDNVSTD